MAHAAMRRILLVPTMATHDDTLLPPIQDFADDERESVRSLEALTPTQFEAVAARRLRSSAPRISLRRDAVPGPSSFDGGFHKVR